MYKKLLITSIVTIILSLGYNFAQSDLYIQRFELSTPYMVAWETWAIQGSVPRVNIVIGNNGPDPVQSNNVWPGLITCNGGDWFWSSYLGNLYIPNGWFWSINNMVLSNNLTTTLWQTISITCQIDNTVAWAADNTGNNNVATISFKIFTWPTGRFDLTLGRSIEDIQGNLDAAEAELWAAGIVNFIRDNIINLLIPIIILLWIVVAIIGFYKMMFSDTEEWTKEWSKYLIRWVVGIVVMMSSRYLASTVLFENILIWGNIGDIGDMQTFNGINVAEILYEQAIFPFIKIAMYLAMWVLFIIVALRVLSYLTNPSEEVRKQAITLIARNVIGILVILWSKQIVELIYGQQADVMEQTAQDLGDIGSGILSGNLPILYTIINRIMGLSAFVILVIIILQTYQLLVNPTDEEMMGKIKKNFLYITIGILVIGSGYVITNFLIIN